MSDVLDKLQLQIGILEKQIRRLRSTRSWLEREFPKGVGCAPVEMTVAGLTMAQWRVEVESRMPDTGCGGTFDELLCHFLHTTDGETYGGYDFDGLAGHFGITLVQLGLLIHDHCYRLAGLAPLWATVELGGESQ